MKSYRVAGQWWRTPLIATLGRQRQEDLCELEASLIYRASSRIGSKDTEKPCLKKPNIYSGPELEMDQQLAAKPDAVTSVLERMERLKKSPDYNCTLTHT